MSDVKIRLSAKWFNPVFLPYLNDETEFQIFLGGGGSGKSKFLSQRLILDLWKGGRNYLCARKVASTIRASIYTEIKKAVYDFGDEFAKAFSFSLEPMKITCNETGNCAMFVGLDDVEKIKSITPDKGVFTDLWVEEATEIGRSDLDQLSIRLRGKSKVPKRRTLSFNPVHNRHWIAKDHCSMLADDVNTYRDATTSILRTTYLDNRFLAPDDITKYERYKATNPAFYRVYGLGLWGTLGDVIFKNWTVEDFNIDNFGQFYHGLDFGFTNDPTAFVSVAMRGDDVYICREIVQKGMSNRGIHNAIAPIVKQSPVTCDSAEPKSIAELRYLGLNTISCSKGADSVIQGIQWLQNKRIHIHTSCKTTAHEFSVYEWDKDKAGDPINRPVDKDNHALDSIRYALNSEIMRSSGNAKFARFDFL
jgi:phage terminase large subunit